MRIFFSFLLLEDGIVDQAGQINRQHILCLVGKVDERADNVCQVDIGHCHLVDDMVDFIVRASNLSSIIPDDSISILFPVSVRVRLRKVCVKTSQRRRVRRLSSMSDGCSRD